MPMSTRSTWFVDNRARSSTSGTPCSTRLDDQLLRTPSADASRGRRRVPAPADDPGPAGGAPLRRARTCASASPAGARCAIPAECAAFNAKRYRWVKKRIERTETVAGGSADGDGGLQHRHALRRVARRHALRRQPLCRPLRGAPRHDRAHGGLERQRRVAAGARRPGHAREGARAVTRAVPAAPLPTHGRFDYRAITRPARLSLGPAAPRLAVYLGFNLEHFAFGEGLGAAHRPAVAAARRAELLAGANTATASAPGAASSCSTSSALPAARAHQHRALRPLPRAGRGVRARAATSSSATATPTPSARACSTKPTSARCSRAAASASTRRAAQRADGLAVAVDLGEPLHARPAGRGRLPLHPQLVPRRPAGPPCARAAASALVGALPAGAERHPDDRRRARWTPRTSRR